MLVCRSTIERLDPQMGLTVSGTSGNDNLTNPDAIADGDDQIHIYANLGDDTIRMGFADTITAGVMTEGVEAEVNGHHAYGSHGLDIFMFENVDHVTDEGRKMVGMLIFAEK